MAAYARTESAVSRPRTPSRTQLPTVSSGDGNPIDRLESVGTASPVPPRFHRLASPSRDHPLTRVLAGSGSDPRRWSARPVSSARSEVDIWTPICPACEGDLRCTLLRYCA